jgi:hypothetical protein
MCEWERSEDLSINIVRWNPAVSILDNQRWSKEHLTDHVSGHIVHVKSFNTNRKYLAVQCAPFPKKHSFLEAHEASPACPFDETNLYMKINTDHWWNGSDRGKPVPVPFCQPHSSRGFSDTKKNLSYIKSFGLYLAVNTRHLKLIKTYQHMT